MSNLIHFERAKIETKQNTTDGFHAYDNYEDSYGTFENKCSDCDKDFFLQLKNANNKEVDSMISHIIEHGSNINIDGQYYEFEEIREWLELTAPEPTM